MQQKKAPTTRNINTELSSIFNSISDCYRYLGKTERFRANAYENAAKTIQNMNEPIESFGNDLKKLDKLKGIGSHIAAKIIEYVNTGKIGAFEVLKRRVPFDLLSLMNIEGVGPATIRKIHDQLPVNTIRELGDKLKKSNFTPIKGVTKTNLEKIIHELKISSPAIKRIPLESAIKMAMKLLELIENIPQVKKAVIAGSIRRKKETIGDIDIVAACDEKMRSKTIEQIAHFECVKRIISKGNSKISMLIKEKDIQADVRIVNADEFGSALLYFTGSKQHNIQLRKLAHTKGYKLNEYGLFNIKRKIAGENEEDIYDALGLKYIKPENRIGANELEENKISIQL